ncbi:phosphatase PAP2 family protein [Methylocucumis oryzae]|uniref:phosphatase PAP2 family protein n=1 Tax=Methylocucumis oryzae TaxID=1632867 RepID=UPI0009E58A2A|nr:phosphatase PAP2 family protein [Methylocucumis oryzae]
MKAIAASPILHRPIITEISLFLSVVALLTLPFWLSDLDIQVAQRFFHADNPDNFWPEEQRTIWVFFYKAIPILVNVLLLGCLGVLAFSGSKPSATKHRRVAFYILFCIILGPGLVVNGIFKDHYGRPRPRQIEQFHGQLAYQPPGMPGAEGKSFPCGHCSVGYVFWVFFFFLNRRKKPLLALAYFVAALLLGLSVGMGRIAAGGHFLSDVLWSGFLTYAVCAWLYYALIAKWENLPDREIPDFILLQHWQNLPKTVKPWLFAALALAMSGLAALATPHKTDKELSLAQLGTALTINANVGDVVLHALPSANNPPHAHLNIKGFGFPTSSITATYNEDEKQLTIAKNGMFTDIEGQLDIYVPIDLANLTINAEQGRIVLNLPTALPAMWQLHAKKGIASVASPPHEKALPKQP